MTFVLAGCGEVTTGSVDSGTQCARDWRPVPLVNGAFDQPSGGWSTEPLTSAIICRTEDHDFPAQSGDQSACFGLYNSAMETLTQTFQLPATATQVRLRGFHCRDTDETSVMPDDTLIIEIRDQATGLAIASLAQWSNLDAAATCSWTPFELSAPLSGQADTATLYFHSALDDLDVTTFYIDTLELETFSCAP